MNYSSDRISPTSKVVDIQHDVIDLESTESDIQSSDNIFKNPYYEKYYRELYEAADYECRHLFDPDLSWSKSEEKKIKWKNDWYITFWAFIMFVALDFDRGNFKQALSDNMLEDLGMSTNDLNTANTVNLVCFLLAELPSQLISKKLGADVWIPIQISLWSIVAMCQSAIKSRGGFIATRAFIGLLEGGFICDVGLWMSYFFTSKELPFRLSIFYIANPLTYVLSSLLAFALLKIRTPEIPEGWRWLYLIEGAFTLLVGICSFFKMPPSVVQTKAWYRRKGWYTDREERILVNKILRDDPSKGDMNNRQHVGPTELFKSLACFDLYPIYLVRFLSDLCTSPVNTYMTLTLRKLGFSTFKTNALAIPYNIIGIVTLLIVGYITEALNSRALVLVTSPIWSLACLLPLRFWKGSQVDAWGTWALLTVLLGVAPVAAVSISWCSHNSNSVRDRAVSSAVVNIFSQLSGIVGANIYRADDAPLYKRGNSALVGIAIAAIFACFFSRFYYIYRNKQKQKQWDSLSFEEQEKYSLETSDKGNRRLDFRFVY